MAAAAYGFGHLHVDAQLVRVGDPEQLRSRRSDPALINAPMSVLRAVTTPSNGATTRLNDSKSRSRDTLAAADSAAAFFAAASPAFSSASCLETDSVASSPFQRSLVLLDRVSLALRRREVRLRLSELLVDFRRFDLGQQIDPSSPACRYPCTRS